MHQKLSKSISVTNTRDNVVNKLINVLFLLR